MHDELREARAVLSGGVTELGHWTVARVKDELPSVQVMFAGRRHLATVSGRLNPFATVSVTTNGEPWLAANFSWEALANALSMCEPLLL